MGDISIDLFLETLEQLSTISNLDYTIEEQHQLQSLWEKIIYLREFLKIAGKRHNTHSEVTNLMVQIRDVVFEAENAVDLFILLVSKGHDHASNSLREHMDHLFLDLKRVEKDIKNLEAEVKQNYDEMGNISLHLFLDSLEQPLEFLLKASDLGFSRKEYFGLQSLTKEIKDLRGLLNIVEKKRNYKHSGGINVVMQIKDMASDVEKAVTLFLVDASKDDHASNSLRERIDHLFLDLERVRKDVKNLEVEVKQIYSEINMYDISEAAVKSLSDDSTGRRAINGGSGSLSGRNPSILVEEKLVVGFEEEVARLLERFRDNPGFEIISIVGPGGCGKTTLAREVYDHPLISEAYEIRAWVVVSKDYDQFMKRDLLIDILKSVFPENHRDYEKSNEVLLGEKLFNILKWRKYLIVMDNIWGIEAWNDIRRSFPREFKGSKVVFTTRLGVMGYKDPYILHSVKPLSTSCSWELLEMKVFRKKRCPPEFVEIGKQIAKKCEGLPLAIVTIAGILLTEEKILSVWQQIADHVSSIIAKKHEGCMELLELSYNHLPLHLKACFLYIGAHPENYEISVRELTWLWIAEGFIQEDEECESLEFAEGFILKEKEWKILEDVAKDYLVNLIDRNLLMTTRTSSIGEIKTCRIHDLLRELCLIKAKEDNFFVQINGDDSSVPSATNKYRRLFIFRQFFDKFFFSRPYPENLRSFLCLGSRHSRIELYMSFFVETFKLLRVFSFVADECRGEILSGQLLGLRYLAVQLSQNVDFPLPFHLFNLKTLTVQTSCLKDIKLSSHIFKMVSLRHLHTKQGIFTYHVYDDEDKGNMLDNLQTLHRMCFCEHCLRFLERTPNLKKLGLIGDLNRKGDDVLMLSDLESLSVCISSIWLRLPPTLTQLSLKQTNLKWEQLSILPQALPSLEVLKLLTGACSGPVWNTTEFEEGFYQLKCLKLDSLDIEDWNAAKGQFINLQVLVIRHCKELKEIPVEFARLSKLREINVKYCHQSVEKSAEKIQKARRDLQKHQDRFSEQYGELNLRFNEL